MKSRLLFLAIFILRPALSLAVPNVIKDVAYLESGRAEKLDVFLPAPPAAGKLLPAVVWIHGGGWVGGTKTEARAQEICTTLANVGYVALNIDYKLGDGSWPTNLLDCKNAVRFLRTHAAEYHVDPARIGVAGGSAGGHLSLLVGLTSGEKNLEPTAPYPGVSSAVRCVIDMYGIANLLGGAAENQPAMKKLMTNSSKAFGATSLDAEVFGVASPVRYVKKDSPPVLIMHGRADPTVDFVQSEELVGGLKERGVAHEFVALDGIGHTFDWETWNKQPLPRDLRPVALAFLAKHLASK